MATIKEEAERILKEAVYLLTKVHRNEASKEKIARILNDIIRLSHQILSEDKEGLRRIGLDLKRILESERVTEEGIQNLGIDFNSLFGS